MYDEICWIWLAGCFKQEEEQEEGAVQGRTGLQWPQGLSSPAALAMLLALAPGQVGGSRMGSGAAETLREE